MCLFWYLSGTASARTPHGPRCADAGKRRPSARSTPIAAPRPDPRRSRTGPARMQRHDLAVRQVPLAKRLLAVVAFMQFHPNEGAPAKIELGCTAPMAARSACTARLRRSNSQPCHASIGKLVTTQKGSRANCGAPSRLPAGRQVPRSIKSTMAPPGEVALYRGRSGPAGAAGPPKRVHGPRAHARTRGLLAGEARRRRRQLRPASADVRPGVGGGEKSPRQRTWQRQAGSSQYKYARGRCDPSRPRPCKSARRQLVPHGAATPGLRGAAHAAVAPQAPRVK
jgi:hypothetical protein